MKTVLALACLLTLPGLGSAHTPTTQARNSSQKVTERTVVLSVRGMT